MGAFPPSAWPLIVWSSNAYPARTAIARHFLNGENLTTTQDRTSNILLKFSELLLASCASEAVRNRKLVFAEYRLPLR
jgi:hypothetical protein